MLSTTLFVFFTFVVGDVLEEREGMLLANNNKSQITKLQKKKQNDKQKCTNKLKLKLKLKLNITLPTALIDLYIATKGPAWINNTNWLNDNICIWVGILCSSGTSQYVIQMFVSFLFCVVCCVLLCVVRCVLCVVYCVVLCVVLCCVLCCVV
jgi:sensor histidine kinase YesM